VSTGTLARIIRGRHLPETPTATFATCATRGALNHPSVVTVASVAVAKWKREKAVPWSMELEERAAIVEHDAGATRLLAETLARCEGCLPTDRLEVLARLIDGGHAAAALALGWSLLDLLAVCRQPPHDAPHIAGMLFSLDPGDRIAAIAADCARIVTPNGTPYTWRRAEIDPEFVCMPWELR
jgi:hypothetical protein